MEQFVRLAILGASFGALDALLAFGVVLIYRTSGVLNFAQAATGAIATYTAYSVSQRAPLWLAVLVGCVAGGICGTLTYASVHGLKPRNYSLTAAVATLASAILIQQIIGILWPTTSNVFPDPFPLNGLTVHGLNIAYRTLGAIVVAIILATIIGISLRFTRIGTMLRALADNQEAARLCGGNVTALLASVWAIAGVLAAIAGMFVAQSGLTSGFLDRFLIAALLAAVLGGLRSLVWTSVGAATLEVLRLLFEYYEPQYFPSHDLSPYTQTFVVLCLILMLVFAPRQWLMREPARRV